MNQLQIFENELFKVSAKQENGNILFNVEEIASNLGFTRIVNGKEYVRWERVNSYLPESCPEVGKGDFVPESLVYKLAFKAQNEVAEKFQDWLAIEVIPQIRKTGSYGIDTTKLSPELQMMNQMFRAVANTELEVEEVRQLAVEANRSVDNISNIVTITNVDWRKKVDVILKKIARKWTGIEPYRSVRNYSYERLEERGACNLNLRLNNRKERAIAQGMTKTFVKNINKLDVIAEEKRLVEIYLQVVKEMAIQFRVDINGFEEVI